MPMGYRKAWAYTHPRYWAYHRRLQQQREAQRQRKAAGCKLRSEGSEVSIARRAQSEAEAWARKQERQRAALEASRSKVQRPLVRMMGRNRRVRI